MENGLELFSDAVLHPTFPQGEADKLLAQSLDAVKGAKDDPQQVLGLYYNGYLYGARPYGWPDGGDEVSLKHINRDAILKFYETYYAPGNTILAVAGEFNAAELRKRLEEVLGVWPVKTIPAVFLDMEASLCASHGCSRAAYPRPIFSSDAGDKDTASHRPVASRR